MKNIFQKFSFPQAPGGNLYDWKDVTTEFEALEDGIYVIKVTASAQNGKQNGTGDDDDLRMALDGYLFGKKEKHQAQISWHSFGVAAAWDGASLKGGNKTIYFFAELKKGKHNLAFRADGKPTLKKIEIFQLDHKEDAIEDVVFDIPEMALGIKVDENGIPWKSFVFQSQFNTDPFRIRLLDITATCRSARQKNGKDGDNIKVYANGRIVLNPIAPTSAKYKNFFFSGDQTQGKTESLMILGDMFAFSESGDFSIELWYDQTPTLEQIKIEIEGGAQYDRTNALDRWRSNIAEWSKLPVDLRNAGWKIREIVGVTWDLTVQYADVHGFFTVDANGYRHHNTVNNEADAFRHFVWNVLLAKEFGEEGAKSITINHEIFWRNAQNKKDFTRESIMDLWNNRQGRVFAKKYPDQSPQELFEIALSKGTIVTRLEEVTRKIRETVLGEINRFLNEI